MTGTTSGQGRRASTAPTGRRRDRAAVIVLAATGFGVGAAVGAYLNWFWWEIGYRPLAIILAVAILIVGGLAAMVGRSVARRLALLMLAVGLGMLAGQHLGPGREPLIHQLGGTMTLSLESPVVRVLTGSADCENVASETEFLVTGGLERPNGQLGLPDSVSVQRGDRWSFPRDTARQDRVRLEIAATTELAPGSIKVQDSIGMEATGSSTLEARFTNAGGSIRFADLVAQGGPAYTGESMNLAGTLAWTCGLASP